MPTAPPSTPSSPAEASSCSPREAGERACIHHSPPTPAASSHCDSMARAQMPGRLAACSDSGRRSIERLVRSARSGRPSAMSSASARSSGVGMSGAV